MTQEILNQAAKLWNLLSAQETAKTYKQTFYTTQTLIRETAVFIWLLLCLVLVGLDWLISAVTVTSQLIQRWVSNLKYLDSEQRKLEIGNTLITVTTTVVSFTVARAKEQLSLYSNRELAWADSKAQPLATSVPTNPLQSQSAVSSSPTTKPDSDPSSGNTRKQNSTAKRDKRNL